MPKPLHIAIIPDANRRWAREKGLRPWEGHEAGAKNLENILEAAHEAGIQHVSFWGSSEDNLQKRPLQEKKALLDIYKRYFEKITDSQKIHENQAHINVFGDWKKQFPPNLKKTIQKAIDKTKHYEKCFVNFFLAYSGDKEMKQAIIKIAKAAKEGKITEITEQTIKENLFTKDLPPVDLLIRSGSIQDPHLSAGFMMWDTQNSQLFFSPKAWPDFDKREFKKALKEYAQRIRRYGE